MKLKEILAISGQSGLYKFVAQSKNGIIVEQLGSGVRSCASASHPPRSARWEKSPFSPRTTTFRWRRYSNRFTTSMPASPS